MNIYISSYSLFEHIELYLSMCVSIRYLYTAPHNRTRTTYHTHYTAYKLIVCIVLRMLAPRCCAGGGVLRPSRICWEV